MGNAARGAVSFAAVVAVAALVATWLAAESRAQADAPSIAGAWTLNKDLSDQPPADRGNRDGDRGQRSGGGYGGRRGRGGFGGGGFGGRGGAGGGQTIDPEERARLREAMRDIVDPPDHLTIAQTDTLVIMTAPDGRTTRLAPDGKKLKDENTGIERKSKWEGGKLVCEITGPGGLKATETYAVAPETHQLRLTTQLQSGRDTQARTLTHVYDADQK